MQSNVNFLDLLSFRHFKFVYEIFYEHNFIFTITEAIKENWVNLKSRKFNVDKCTIQCLLRCYCKYFLFELLS